MNSLPRAGGLDGLRGLAAAAVVLLHVWMFSGAHDPGQAVLVDEIVGTAGLALMMFFVLSGYLVSAPWIRAGLEGTPPPDLRRYAVRRAVRILPAYWACLVGAYVVMQQIEHPLAVDASELPLFAAFAMNQTTATAGQLNPPLWSLGVEVAFYLALPVMGALLVTALRRHGRTGALAVCTALTAFGLLWTAYAHLTGDDPVLVAALPTYLPIFACGIALAALLHDRSIGRPARTVLVLAGAALVTLDGWWHHDGTGFLGHVVRDLPAGMGFAMIAGAVAKGPARLLGTLPLRRLGDYSYGIYLWHMPVIYLMRHGDRWPQSPWEAFALVLGISTVLGALSWHLMEQRVVAWAARRLRRSSPTPPPTSPALAAAAAVPERATVPGAALAGAINGPDLGLAAQHRRATPSSGHHGRARMDWATPIARLDDRPPRPTVRVRRLARPRR